MKKALGITSLWTMALFSFFAFQEKTNWPLLRFAGIRSFSFFTDLGWVFKSADSAKIIGWNIYNPQPPKDYSPYLYGSNLIRVIDLLGLNESHTKVAGWTLMFLFASLLGFTIFLINNRSFSFSLFAFLVLVSPPNQLLLERGNFDLVIIMLLFLLAIAVYRGKFSLSLILVVFGSLLKYYPVPMLAWFWFIWDQSKKRVISLLVFLVTAIYILFDIKKIQIEFPRPSWAAFGNPIFGVYFHRFQLDLHPRVQDFIGIALLVGVLIILKHALLKFKVDLPTIKVLSKPDQMVNSLLSVFVLVFLICYFSSTSFDYRLVYLMIPVLVYINRINDNLKVKTFFCSMAFLSFWLSYNTGDLQLFGDLAILFWVGIFIRGIGLEFREVYNIKSEFVKKLLNYIV